MRPDRAPPSAPSRWHASASPMGRSGRPEDRDGRSVERTARQWTPGIDWGGIRPVSDAHESRAESETEVLPAVGSGGAVARTQELPVVEDETVVTPPPDQDETVVAPPGDQDETVVAPPADQDETVVAPPPVQPPPMSAPAPAVQ